MSENFNADKEGMNRTGTNSGQESSGEEPIRNNPSTESIPPVAYYSPTIPEIVSTSRYQHALSVVERSVSPHLISNNPIPDALTSRSDSTLVIDGGGVVNRAQAAVEFARETVPNGAFVTSYHYEAALAGAFAMHRGPTWIADLFETPAQYRLNQPQTYHQVTARGLAGLLKTAPTGIHTAHPRTAYQYGRRRAYVSNGAPVEHIEPAGGHSGRLRIVWAGSPRMDRGGEILVGALEMVEEPIRFDIYGHEDPELAERLSGLNADHEIIPHGRVGHDVCLEAFGNADVGYCVLPSRPDWRYASPIKVGEAMAGGAIPLASRFPGISRMAGPAGWYVKPTPEATARAIDTLNTLSNRALDEYKLAARTRAERVSWGQMREEWATNVGMAIDRSQGGTVTSPELVAEAEL